MDSGLGAADPGRAAVLSGTGVAHPVAITTADRTNGKKFVSRGFAVRVILSPWFGLRTGREVELRWG
jgi:hypothetical protein